MGEYAEDAINDSLAEWEYADSWEDPDFSHEYFADGGLFGGYSRYRKSATVMCKFCQQGPFEWGMAEKGWRLFDAKGNMHSCRKAK